MEKFSLHLQVISLDATSGGLCVSVCTGNKLQIWDTRQGLLRVNLDSHLHLVQSYYNILTKCKTSVLKFTLIHCPDDGGSKYLRDTGKLLPRLYSTTTQKTAVLL
jgi:hypothetical protein